MLWIAGEEEAHYEWVSGHLTYEGQEQQERLKLLRSMHLKCGVLITVCQSISSDSSKLFKLLNEPVAQLN